MAYNDDIKTIEVYFGYDGTVVASGSWYPAQTGSAAAYPSSDISSGGRVIATSLSFWPFVRSPELSGLTIYAGCGNGGGHPYLEGSGVIQGNIVFRLEIHETTLSMIFGPALVAGSSVTLPEEGGRIDFSEWRFDSLGTVTSQNAGTYQMGYLIAKNGVYTPPQPTPPDPGPTYPTPEECSVEFLDFSSTIIPIIDNEMPPERTGQYWLKNFVGLDLYSTQTRYESLHLLVRTQNPPPICVRVLALQAYYEDIATVGAQLDVISGMPSVDLYASNPEHGRFFKEKVPEYCNLSLSDGYFILNERIQGLLFTKDHTTRIDEEDGYHYWEFPTDCFRYDNNSNGEPRGLSGFQSLVASGFLASEKSTYFYFWGFDPNNECLPTYVGRCLIPPLRQPTRRYELDQRVYLVDTPCGSDHCGEDTRGTSWDDAITEHTLENALYFAKDGATIRFDGCLMEDDTIPTVCDRLSLSSKYSITIDALLPYKVEHNNIVEDTDVTNWKGVLLDHSRLDFDVRAVIIDPTDTEGVALRATVRGVSFSSGKTSDDLWEQQQAIDSMSPCCIDRCSFDGIRDEAVCISSIYRSYTINESDEVEEDTTRQSDVSAITHSVFKNCGTHTVSTLDDEYHVYAGGRALKASDGPLVDNCLFINNSNILSFGTFLNCTIIGPTDPPREIESGHYDVFDNPAKTDDNTLTCLHVDNCFVAGYSPAGILGGATNSIVIHNGPAPSPTPANPEAELMPYDKYNSIYLGEGRQNEVYERFGEEGAPTVSDFFYSNYHPRSTNEQYSVIDKGSNQLIEHYEITTDLAENPRIIGDTVDIGCYEWIPNDPNGATTVTWYAGVYDGFKHAIIMVEGVGTDGETVVNLTDQATVYVFANETSYDFSGMRDPEMAEEITQLLEQEAVDIYYPDQIPQITHVPTDEWPTEMEWSLGHYVAITVPSYELWQGEIAPAITPRPLYLENLAVSY